MAAGRAMMPAPTMVVERLNTAPENDEPSKLASPALCFKGLRRWVLGLLRLLRSEKDRAMFDINVMCEKFRSQKERKREL